MRCNCLNCASKGGADMRCNCLTCGSNGGADMKCNCLSSYLGSPFPNCNAKNTKQNKTNPKRQVKPLQTAINKLQNRQVASEQNRQGTMRKRHRHRRNLSNCCTTETEATTTKEETNHKLTEASPHTMKVQEVGPRGKRMKSLYGG